MAAIPTPDSAASGAAAPTALALDAGSTSTLRTLGAWLATVLVLAVALGFAGLTVEQAAYTPVNAFGSFADYFKLFSAALASSAAGTVLAVAGYWKVDGAATAAK